MKSTSEWAENLAVALKERIGLTTIRADSLLFVPSTVAAKTRGLQVTSCLASYLSLMYIRTRLQTPKPKTGSVGGLYMDFCKKYSIPAGVTTVGPKSSRTSIVRFLD